MRSSIIISSYRRTEFLKQTLNSIYQNPPPGSFEVILGEEISEATPENVDMATKYGFPIKIVHVDMEKAEKELGFKKYLNDPSLTYNAAFAHASGEFIFTQGNEVLAIEGTYTK